MLQYHSSTCRGSAERNRKVSGIEGRLTTERVTVTPGEEAFFFVCEGINDTARGWGPRLTKQRMVARGGKPQAGRHRAGRELRNGLGKGQTGVTRRRAGTGLQRNRGGDKQTPRVHDYNSIKTKHYHESAVRERGRAGSVNSTAGKEEWIKRPAADEGPGKTNRKSGNQVGEPGMRKKAMLDTC